MVGQQGTARAWNQGGQAFDEGERVEDEMGRAIAPRTTELMRHSSVGQERETLGRERRPGDVAGEPLELLALVVLDPHCRVQREPFLVST